LSQREPNNSSFAPRKRTYPRKFPKTIYIRVFVLTLIVLTALATPFSFPMETAQAEEGLKAGTVARVSGTDGDGARLRSSASTSAATVEVLLDTWQVTILGGPVKDNQGNSFYKVEWANRTGYVMTKYVSKSGSGGFAVGSEVRITGTDGDGVRLRSAPNTGAGTISTLDENWLATVVGGPFRDNQGNDYYKLEWTGKTGFANSDYLAFAGKKSTVSTSTQSNATSKLTIGGQAKVTGTNGDGVRLRQQANPLSSTLTVLGETYLVTVLGGPFRDNQGNNYHRVEWAGYTGFVRTDFLAQASKTAVAGQGGFMRITNTDGDPIRFRTGPSKDAGLNGYVYEGQVFKLLAGPFKDAEGNNWYRVDRKGEVGYVLSTFTQRTNTQNPVNNPAPAPKTEGRLEPAPAKPAIPVPPTSGPRGQRLSDYALQFVGYRYVYAGKSPAAGGFDCSGFVHWVYGQTIEVFTGWTAADNSRFGIEVPLDALEPGDILVWANTYMPGPSHSGIYIGGGRFVHAANEGTGVTINGINEAYYAKRFYSARRFVG
jgi:cell wall-associated NlpC family hydrolase